jgi:hypothetical protein
MNVTLGDHAGSAKLREQLRVEPIIFHLGSDDRFGLFGVSNDDVEILVESIVDRVVIADCFALLIARLRRGGVRLSSI